MITVTELAEILGITYDRALRLIKSLGLGEKRAGIWLITGEEMDTAKANCRTYILANR